MTGACVCHVSGVCEAEQSTMNHMASIEVRLDADGFERTGDGKFQCRYCSYASKGQARLIEHMRTHTGPTQGSGNSFLSFFSNFKGVNIFAHDCILMSVCLSFLTSCACVCVCVKERSLTVVSSVRSPRRMSDSWKHTCAHTRVRSRISVSFVRSAVTTGATFLTIAAAGTNSAP